MLKRSSLALLLFVAGCGDNVSPGADPAPDPDPAAGNLPPVPRVASLAMTLQEDGSVVIDATSTDPEGQALTYVASSPPHGTISGAGPTFIYIPDANFNGPDALQIAVSDGPSSILIPVALTITPVADPPTSLNQLVSTQEDGAVELSLQASDVDSSVVSYRVVTPPVHGTLSGAAPNLIYTPDAHFYGEETLVFVASDGELESSTATITIAVANVITCGDGIAEGAEACDDGNPLDSDGCLTTCVSATCGDGLLQAGVEQCDDGNADDADSCHNNCTFVASPVCGDGALDAGEECDDGNVADNDGCGHSCLVERCGDGLTQLSNGESCDDGNTSDGDGCDAACHVEPFQTTAPVLISGALACSTAVANAARKIAVDGSGAIYAVMRCDTSADVVVSTDRGLTFSAPLDLSTGLGTPGSPITVSQVAVATGPSGVAYVAIMAGTGEVYLRTTESSGHTWSAGVLIGQASSTSSGLSLQAFNDNVYVGFSTSGGVLVTRNSARGVGSFESTAVAMSIAYFDLLYDPGPGTLVVCADTPAFHVRASADGGVTFGAEVNPPGSEYYSDWAFGNGSIFASGTNLGASGNATLLYVIPTSDLTTSSSVAGLPSVSSAQTRSLAADTSGNAYVASQLNGGGVQLDRLAAGATAFDAPRLLSATGGSPVAAPLPGTRGAAVVYTVGTEVWATVQAY